ncbi:MAG: T9SS type A sorting domain-containing protein [Bacteroidia bacterium]|nr:T9SS type A sorting domain-containing protein [Bacteroidia bacterium]
MISFNNALKVDSFFFLSAVDNNIYRSTDLIHWQHHTSLGKTNQFSAPTVYSFKGRLFNGEFWSNDYGINWVECKKKTPGRILHVSQLANGDLINFYYNYFYYKTAVSHDNGITWQDTLVSQWENIKNIAPHGQYIYCLTDNGIRVLDKLTLSLVREYPVGENISLGSEVYYANNNIYATALYGGLYLWEDDLPTGTNHQKPITNSDKIYPNPANRYITIENSDKEMLECTLINMAGYEILTRKGNSKLTIETTELPDGLYIVKLETTKGISYSKILIVH